MPDTVVRLSIADAAAALPAAARAAAGLPGKERKQALRRLLRADVHDVVMHAGVAGQGGPADLAALAEAVRDHVPAGVEDGLSPRVMVFVRLLRHGAFDAAWTLANDNASGVLRPPKAPATWAGGSHLNTPLALPTVVDGDEVYAWLPGFRDPRWGVPDDVFAVTSQVVLRSGVELAVFRAGALELAGVGYLELLEADPSDVVTLELTGPDGARSVVQAQRRRRPTLVKPRGPDLTRLAWGGWFASVDLGALAGRRGAWRVQLSVTQQGVHRRTDLPTRGAASIVDDSCATSGWRYRLDSRGRNRDLVVRVSAVPSGAWAVVGRLRRTGRPG